ncbi:glycosyltransferase [Enterococcus camelliae]|uniref:Glycosyltransferase n=1 Tax=Enterococcus camelliae TaxID=453959 RepID=A0ABW5TII4_9ENTE
MMKYSSYSVLMSVYYKEEPKHLSDSIQSILNQSFKTDDFIIVKDGPLTLELENVLEWYVNKFPLIKIISLKKNVGLGLALNEGLRHCKNELVARMDSDDICTIDRCKLQVERFSENKKLIILGTQIAEFYDSPENIVSVREVPNSYEEIVKFSKRRSPFNHPTVMYKKSKILELGGYKDIKRKEDLELFLNALSNNYYSENLNFIGLFFRSNKYNYIRRKDITNCLNYIAVIFIFLKKGYCSINDFLFVLISQLFFIIAPTKVMKFISDNLLRRKIENEEI